MSSEHVPFPTAEEAKRILEEEGIDTTELKKWASGKLAEIKQKYCQHDFELTWPLDPCEYTCRKCGRKEQA